MKARVPLIGPLEAQDPATGQRCPGCNDVFVVGDFVTMLAIGPGSDPARRLRASQGKRYNPVVVTAHFACVTGVEMSSPAEASA